MQLANGGCVRVSPLAFAPDRICLCRVILSGASEQFFRPAILPVGGREVEEPAPSAGDDTIKMGARRHG